jgi:hypothetical protein
MVLQALSSAMKAITNNRRVRWNAVGGVLNFFIFINSFENGL